MCSFKGKICRCLPDIWRWSVLSFIGASKSFHQPRKKGSSKNESLTSMNTSFPAFFVLFSAMLFDIVAFDWISGSPVRVRPFQMILVLAKIKFQIETIFCKFEIFLFKTVAQSSYDIWLLLHFPCVCVIWIYDWNVVFMTFPDLFANENIIKINLASLWSFNSVLPFLLVCTFVHEWICNIMLTSLYIFNSSLNTARRDGASTFLVYSRNGQM